MLLLAAKIGLLGSTFGQLAPAENMTWQKLRNSVATLTSKGTIALGPAVFISTDGYAVANSDLITKGASDLITSSGLTYKFKVEATDAASQLSLLKTTIRPAGISVVQTADQTDGQAGAILAVMPNGVLRAELTGGEKVGMDQKTKRTFPVQEVRVEQPALQMGGALLFSKQGRLIGALFAALPQESLDIQQNFAAGGAGSGDQRQSPTRSSQNAYLNSRNLGPQGMVVAYTPTWEVTGKAISGFLSPDKKPQYGLLGVFVIEHKQGGVEIQTIQKDSSAESAGLEVGDVIIGIAGTTIRNQIDFSRAIYRLVPGSTISIDLRRKGVTKRVTAIVGSQMAQVDGHRQSSIGLSYSLDTH